MLSFNYQIIKNKRFLIFFIFSLFFITSMFAIDVNTDQFLTTSEYLESIFISIVGFFDNKFFKGICCLFLIGEAIAIMWIGNSNASIIKKLIPLFVGTVLFCCSARLVTVLFGDGSSFNLLGSSKMPTFTHYIDPTHPNYEKGITSLINIPILQAFYSFSQILDNIRNVVLLSCIIFCFLNIVFNAMKLWAGTIELKKLYVDLIYKFMLVLILCSIYPYVQQKVIQVGMSIGVTASGGYNELNETFTTAFNDCIDEFIQGCDDLYGIIGDTMYLEDEDGIQYMTTKQYKKMINLKDMSKSDVDEYLKRTNTKVVKKGIFSGWTGEYKTLSGTKVVLNQSLAYDKEFEKKRLDEASDTLNIIKVQRQKLGSLCKILCGETLEDLINDKEVSFTELALILNDQIQGVWYYPYFVSDNNNPTYILAPASILKSTSLMIEQVTQASGFGVIMGDGLHITTLFSDILEILKRIILWLCCYISQFYILCSYMLSIIEYLIVTSLAPILIPFFFIDSVKSYAQNVIGLMVKYLIKFMIIGMTTFWSLSQFMSVMITNFNSECVTDIWAFSYTVLSILLITMVCLFSEKYTNALVSGNPSLGTGDIHHLAHDASTIGHRAAMNAGKLTGKLIEKEQAVGRGVANTVSNFTGGYKGQKDAIKSHASDYESKIRDGSHAIKDSNGATINPKNLTNQQIKQHAMKEAKKDLGSSVGAGFKSVGGQIKQDVGDKAYKVAFGKDKQHVSDDGRNTEGHIKLGQDIIKNGTQRKATMGDVKNQASHIHKPKATPGE